MSEQFGTWTASEMSVATMAEGREALSALRAWMDSQDTHYRNEAQTRLDIINRLVCECFGWSNSADRKVRVEVLENGERTDYELGQPRVAIWEAKREGASFNLPPGIGRKAIHDLPSIIQRGETVREAFSQAQGYCNSRGVELAVITNGHQLVCFLASRGDGISPAEGNCFVVESLEQLDSRFATAWDLFSPDGIAEKRYVRILKHGGQPTIPAKLSSYLREYPKHRYLSDLQANLRTLSELLLQDIGETEVEEERFYERCYCLSGALSQHALMNRNLLEARYAALGEASQLNTVIESANPKGLHGEPITPDVLQEALSKRPVILIGDVGVGKTSFLKHLIYRGAKKVFDSALYVYVNLGVKGTLNTDIKQVVLREVERQLLERYQIDIREATFLKGTYAADIERFRRGAFGDVFTSNPEAATLAQAQMLHGFASNQPEHVRRSIEHLSKGRHHQVIFILDNADQRKDEVQQEAFLIAQELAKDWSCHVFISLRPDTFYRSRTAGVLAAYPHRVFTVSPPRIDEFLEKRLTYALDMAEGRMPVERLFGLKLNIGSIAAVIRALLQSLERNDDLQELLANITGGNVRELLQFITTFFGSPNVNAEKIVEIAIRERSYRIPLHEFSKAALLGDYSHYHAESSLAMNVFDVRSPDPREHFLVLLILAFLDFEGDHRDLSGFSRQEVVLTEMMGQGFTATQIEDAIRRCIEKRLVETPHREIVTVAPGQDRREKYRMTARGAYHCRRWVPTFAYIDAMSFDTPILDEGIRERALEALESFSIRDRFERASAFRKYLKTQWLGGGIQVKYFDFNSLMQRGEQTFSAVARVARSP